MKPNHNRKPTGFEDEFLLQILCNEVAGMQEQG